jgi:hypothetical protein
MAEKQKLAQLAARPYKDQAVWFLNAFWDQLQAKGEAEKLWSFVHKAAELDLERKADGTELDEFQAHRFLEHFKETMTVQAMRDKYPPPAALSPLLLGVAHLFHGAQQKLMNWWRAGCGRWGRSRRAWPRRCH